MTKMDKMSFVAYKVVELIGLPELAGELSRRRSDGCTVHLPLRRQATPQNSPNLRRGEMFPRRALFKHRLLTSERRDQVDMIWHNDRIRQHRPVTFEMQEPVSSPSLDQFQNL